MQNRTQAARQFHSARPGPSIQRQRFTAAHPSRSLDRSEGIT
jgi:hypothetical protein